MITFKDFLTEKASGKPIKGLVHNDFEDTEEQKKDVLKDRAGEHAWSPEDHHMIFKDRLISHGKGGTKTMADVYKANANVGSTKAHHDTYKTFDKLFSNKDLHIPSGHVLYHGTNKAPTFNKDGLHVRGHLISTTPHFHEAVLHAAKSKKDDTTEEDPKYHHVIAIHHEGKAPVVNLSQHTGKSHSETEVVHGGAAFEDHLGSEESGVHPHTGKTILVHHVKVAFQHPRHNTYEENKAIGQKELDKRRAAFTN